VARNDACNLQPLPMNAFDYFFENTQNLDKLFVLGPKETISYKDLYDQSIKLTAYLNNKVGSNQNILLLAPNSVFFITAYLAILKSGNVVVPLNPDIEQSNLDFIQDKCRANLIFTTPQLTTKLNFEKTAVFTEKDLDQIFHKAEVKTPNTHY
jgi:long-chain acyl-CoA synthetase